MNIKEKLEEIRSQKEKIEKRKAEIRSMLDNDEKADLDALQKELTGMESQMKELEEREKGLQKRQTILDGLSQGKEPEGVNAIENPEERGKKMGDNIFDTPEYRNAFMNFVCRGIAIPKEFREAGPTKTSDIGALVPPVTLNKVLEKMDAVGMILPLVTHTNYRTGMNIPTSSVKPVATWVAEGVGSDKQKKTLDTTITFSHNKLRCAVSVTLETEYMAYSAFETALVNNMAEAMTKALEEAILKGDGTGKPTGILYDAAKGKKEEVAALSYDVLTAAEADLDLSYEAGAVWVMTKKTFMAFVGMKDADGQPIARVNYGIAGAPERVLLGRRVVLTEYLPSFSDKLKKTDVFAFLYRMSDYTLNTNFSIGIKTYEDNETDDIIRKSIMVCDGKPVDYGSLVKLTGATE